MTSTLRGVLNGDPARLAQVAGEFLRACPVEHNVILTTLARTLARDSQERPSGQPADLWWWVEDGDRVVAVLMHTPPHGAAVSTGPDAAMALLARTLLAERRGLTGVGGLAGSARAFAQGWQAAGAPAAAVGMRQGLLVADSVVDPAPVDGRHRLATAVDLPTLRPWGTAFVREATPYRSRDHRDVDHVTWRVANSSLHVWDVDGEPVSMAAVTPPAADVARVQLVYTPPALRGNGFAAACVAALTRDELAHAGRRCMLYTDLANPTSNALYERVGYRRVGEALDLLLATD